MTDPNQPPSPGPDWCYSCNRSEPIPAGGCYRLCGECFHCFHTYDDLVLAARETAREVGVTPPEFGDEILFCPLCAHDF